MALHDATLTKVEMHTVFGILTSQRFNPGDFEWSETEQGEFDRRRSFSFRVSRIVHPKTGYWFIFGGIGCSFTPGARQRTEIDVHMNDWLMKASSFHMWLHRLREEVSTPDLWSSHNPPKEPLDSPSSINPED